jgi:hypothetical protein
MRLWRALGGEKNFGISGAKVAGIEPANGGTTIIPPGIRSTVLLIGICIKAPS